VKLRHLATRPHPALVAVVYLALTAHALARGRETLGIVAGLVAWSVVEYAAHRWLLHGFTGRVYDFLHGGHHRDASNLRRGIVPLTHSLASALVLHVIAWRSGTWSALGGLLAGYLAFEVVHAMLHTRKVKMLLPRALRRHHARHHWVDDKAAFGVTSPLWDWILGTMPHAPHPFAVCDEPEGVVEDSSEAI
jgi:sterol desaturase/sphingolipid hydroxylase (fatty acid hydroxylase superfamily)